MMESQRHCVEHALEVDIDRAQVRLSELSVLIQGVLEKSSSGLNA